MPVSVSWIWESAAFARCERPVAALAKTEGDHPGRLRVGPEENSGDTGFIAGLAKADIAPSSIM